MRQAALLLALLPARAVVKDEWPPPVIPTEGAGDVKVPFPDKNVIMAPWAKQKQGWDPNPDFGNGQGAWNHGYFEYGYDQMNQGMPYRRNIYPCPKDTSGVAIPFLNISTIAGEGTIPGETRLLLPLPTELWPYKRYTVLHSWTERVPVIGNNSNDSSSNSSCNSSNSSNSSCPPLFTTVTRSVERSTFGSVHLQPGKTNEELHYIKAVREKRAGMGGLVDMKGRVLEVELFDATQYKHVNADVAVLCGEKKEEGRARHHWSYGGKFRCSGDYGDGKKCD